MKLFTAILSIGLLSVASAQNCSMADYTNITLMANALAANLNVTNGLMNAIPNNYSYSGYSDYWSDMSGMNLNMMGNSFALMASNATTALIQILRNFSLVAANTSATSNQSLIALQALIGQSYISILPPSSADMFAMQLSSDINTQLMNLNGFISNLLMNVGQLGYAGLPPTASNILKILPSPLLVQGLIQSMQNVTNVYIKYMNTTAAALANVYNVFKSSDPTLRAWDLVKNQTVYNWTLATNTTQGSFNSTLVNFTKQANAMYNSFYVSLPTALKNNANFQSDIQSGQSLLASFNMSMQSFQDQFVSFFDQIRMQISMLDQQFLYNILSMIKNYRQQIFSNYQMNATTLNCSIAMLNASEALWKAYGGPSNFFVCITNDNSLLPKLLPFLQAFMATFQQDLNATLADFQKCLTIKNLTNDQNNPMPYSMQQCLENNGMALSATSSSLSQYASGFGQLLQGMISTAGSRIQSCLSDTQSGLYSTFYPVTMNYSTCVMKTMGG